MPNTSVIPLALVMDSCVPSPCLYRVPHQKGGTCGIAHPEIGGAEVLSVDVHHRTALIYLDQLVKGQQHGHPLPGAVGAAGQGGGGAGGVISVVGKGDGLAIVGDGERFKRIFIVSVLLRHLNIHQGDLHGNMEVRQRYLWRKW